ncbi:MAG: trypsin-like peptidase domain-containing protein [Rhodobacteraceae bacterium]|nr:trypsin-like peptidase domain-containing protein [Paracoccaceae bacterium]
MAQAIGEYGRRARMVIAAMMAVMVGLIAQGAEAQDRAWVQLEAFSELVNAQARAGTYAQLVEDVNGFRTPDGLYAIVIGPFAPDAAATALNTLRNQGVVPLDSFITDDSAYVSQFFPVGATVLTDPAPQAPATQEAETPATEDAASNDTTAPEAVAEPAPEPIVEEVAEAEPAPAPAPLIPEETVQEARQSEAQLDREGRDALQIALAWYGYYTGAIDGAFGPGTRGSMSAWQQDKGYEPTGVLTSRQRAELLGDYRGELAALGMETVTSDVAGIEIDLPLAMVEFAGYNFPFAQYTEINDSGVQILLISQPGTETTLFGLYEIMQTLEIVPLDGERERGRDSFLLTGQSDTLRSHTEARLVRGTVKGFTIVWPPERDDQIARVLPMMQSTISYIDGVLDPAVVPETMEDGVDMVSGLEVRTPDRVRTGFFIDADGTVLTTTEAVGDCAQTLINDSYEAELAYSDADLGIAVLRPLTQLAPLAFGVLAEGSGRVQAPIAVSGFPFDGTLSTASMSFGTLAALEGMNGETTLQRLDIATAESEAGAPVLDFTGSVTGMVLPGTVSGRTLPADVTLALQVDALRDALTAAGLVLDAAPREDRMNEENLARLGADMTVTVSCWN